MLSAMCRLTVIVSLVLLPALVAISGCKKQQTASQQMLKPDYARRLEPGQSALRKITDPARMPNLAAAYQNRDFYLDEAMDHSVAWFGAPSSKQFFPFETITHDQARASLYAFRQIAQSASDETEFTDQIKQKFDVYESVGYNGEGIVLYTGYYSPIFHASKTKTGDYQYPLYRRPADLVSDPKTGDPKGRKLANGAIVPYPTRQEIETTHMLKGTELVWLRDPLDAYIIHVNGSAKLLMPDDHVMYVGYAGKTDRPYKGLGQSMVDAGLIKADELSLPAIRHAYEQNPQRVLDLTYQNESYVFFQAYEGDKWPAGSLGVKVSPESTLATDKKIYPRGGLVMVDTQGVTISAGKRRFQRFMLDQDTGGAIQAPGRADIYMGWGSSAEILAGGQYAEGRLYYFFLKPEFVEEALKTAPLPRANAKATKNAANATPAKNATTPEK
jgi:membrane-bound lytic murein transglycosylase A